MTKTCDHCQAVFSRPSKCGPVKWETRRFCSLPCVGRARGAATRAHLISEVAWIVDHDHPESVAKRVGYTNLADLIDKLRRMGAPELAEKLARNRDRYRRGEIAYREESFA